MHSHIRTGAGAAALAAALLLTGCSSDSGGNGGDAKSPSAKPPAGSGTGGGETPEAPSGDAGNADIKGSWTATTNGKLVVLTVQDDMAGIAGEHLCTGRAVRTGKILLDLKCANGNTDRTKGNVTPGADGRTLTVKWEGSGIEDKFSKAPSDAVPSGMPTGLPTMPKLP
ncbi:hypothetical protein ACH4SP_15670 [Streptomyces sp. NPDC021093]|uniref:hypothetical protein n=1 Tax=Streptomyces sp. NPDC021093 TaxID=3365112 RepID=UPI0037B700CF